MLNENAATLNVLPVDALAMRVLADLVATREWNQYNYGLSAHSEVANSIAEALEWLRANGLIARTPGHNNADAIFVTRAGHQALLSGLGEVRAIARLNHDLHPEVEAESRPQFLLGKYELAVFAAMKAVEIRVRELGGFGSDLYGVDLMNRAFGPTGPLTDPDNPRGEQDGLRFLFAGAYAVLRNPAGHREVNYDDVAEAAEAVITASLLMRMLDRVEARLPATPQENRPSGTPPTTSKAKETTT